MDDLEAPIAFPDPQYLEDIEPIPSQALQPTNHTAPTLQPTTTPHTNLAALLADIPSTIQVENLSLSVS